MRFIWNLFFLDSDDKFRWEAVRTIKGVVIFVLSVTTLVAVPKMLSETNLIPGLISTSRDDPPPAVPTTESGVWAMEDVPGMDDALQQTGSAPAGKDFATLGSRETIKKPGESGSADIAANDTPRLDKGDYTAWKTNSVRFSKAPVSQLRLCRTAPTVSIKVLTSPSRLLINGAEIDCTDGPRDISNTCRILCYELDSDRSYETGGVVIIEYREER